MKHIIIAVVFCGCAFAQTGTFPTPATDADLLVARDSCNTFLTSSVDASTLTLPVSDSTCFAAYMVVRIEDEQVKICSKGTGVLTVCAGTRGFNSTSAATHASLPTGANCTSGNNVIGCVRGVISSYYHNTLRAEIKATQANMLAAYSVSALPATCFATAIYVRTSDDTIHRCNAGGTTYSVLSSGGATSENPYSVNIAGWASSGSETVTEAAHGRGAYANGQCLVDNGTKDEIVACKVERSESNGDLTFTYTTKPDFVLIFRGDKAPGPTGPAGPTGPGIGGLLTTKGDMVGYDTNAVRVPVGTNGKVPIADSTQGVGWRWGDVAGVSLCAATGTTSMTCTPSPALKNCNAGEATLILYNAAANTGAVTLTVTGCSAGLSLTRGPNGLVSGELKPGEPYVIIKNSTGFSLKEDPAVAGDDSLTFDPSTNPPNWRVATGVFGRLLGNNQWDGAATFTNASISLTNLPVYADNAAAIAGGLAAGRQYRTSTGDLKVRY